MSELQAVATTHAEPGLQPATPRTKVLAIGMIAGPVTLLAHSVATNFGDYPMSGVLQMYAMAGLMMALVAITQLTEAALPRASAVVSLVGAVGIMGGVAYGMSNAYGDNGAADLNDGTGLDARLGLHLPGPILPLTFIGLGLLLIAARIGPGWCGPVLIVGAILFPITRIGDLPAIAPVSDLLVLAGLAPAAVAMLRGAHPGSGSSRR